MKQWAYQRLTPLSAAFGPYLRLHDEVKTSPQSLRADAFPEKRVTLPTGIEQMAPEMQVGNSHFMKKIEHILEN